MTATSTPTGYDLYATTVTAAGDVSDSAGTLISGAPRDERNAAIAADPQTGSFLIAYSSDWRAAYRMYTDSICGDGTLDVGERCDDGNFVSGDGCSHCLQEPRHQYR